MTGNGYAGHNSQFINRSKGARDPDCRILNTWV
jgi:hypothetical protein